jgi:hypothetical protein
MNKEEARSVLAKALSEYRTKTYSELLYLLESQDTSEVTAESGTNYQLEIQAVWDDKENGNLRVMGSLDDGRWRVFTPLTDDFIMAPDGTFVGE